MIEHLVRLGGDVYNTDDADDLALAVLRLAAGDARGNVLPAAVVTERSKPTGWWLHPNGKFSWNQNDR